MKLKTRLTKLENKSRVALTPIAVFCADGIFGDNQQRRKDSAEAEDRKVRVTNYEIVD